MTNGMKATGSLVVVLVVAVLVLVRVGRVCSDREVTIPSWDIPEGSTVEVDPDLLDGWEYVSEGARLPRSEWVSRQQSLSADMDVIQENYFADQQYIDDNWARTIQYWRDINSIREDMIELGPQDECLRRFDVQLDEIRRSLISALERAIRLAEQMQYEEAIDAVLIYEDVWENSMPVVAIIAQSMRDQC